MRKAIVSRIGLLGSAAALALVGLTSGAQAYQTKFGDLEISFDTTISSGASVRTADRNAQYLAQVNGGSNTDRRLPYFYFEGNNFAAPNAAAFGTSAPVASAAGTVGVISLNPVLLGDPTNAGGSINSDDGRLNYDAGDLTSANIKATHDLQVKWENFTFFARWSEFYDAILNDADHGERSRLSDSVTGQVGHDATLLDAFVSADFQLFDQPLNIRVGKQVISWGESTFILNGINVVNPVDVNAFRRPGAEIKEGLIPVNSIFASVGLPIEGMSLAAFYMLDFEPFNIDAPGTPFSGSDVLDRVNQDFRGNFNGRGFVSGDRFSGTFRRNCNTGNAGVNHQSGARQLAASSPFLGANAAERLAAYDASIHSQCAAGLDPVDFDFTIPLGQGEFVKNTFQDQNFASRASANLEAQADGQFGLRLNYYAEELGGTEFGFYYMNYHSRLPIVSYRSTSPSVGIATTGRSSGGSGRALLPAACQFTPTSIIPTISRTGLVAPDGYLAAGPNLLNEASSFYAGGEVERKLFAETTIADPNNYEQTMAAVAAAFYASGAFGALGVAEATDPVNGILARAALSGNGRADLDNLMRINCALMAVQTGTVDPDGAGPIPAFTGLFDGAEVLNPDFGTEFFFDYPEDIELFGASFNTVLFGWGIQGEVSYRPNAPFQTDTDEAYIASVFTHCASFGIGSSVGNFFQTLQTRKQFNCPYNDDLTMTAAQKAAAGITIGNTYVPGYITGEMFTGQIGTTATYTNSEWWVEMVGADLAVLLTEVGFVHVPGVEDSWANAFNNGTTSGANYLPSTRIGVQYQNSGCQLSDLPLGSFVGLNTGRSSSCRPKDTSAGYVFVKQLQYNNAFGTGFVLTPTLAFSHDFYGTTPSPYGNYVQDRMSASLSMGATLNNNLRLNVGYTNFWGGHINNKSQDQDFASFSASYSF